MALSDNIAQIISSGSARRSAALSEGFASIEQAIVRKQEREYNAPLRNLMIKKETAQMDLAETQMRMIKEEERRGADTRSIYSKVAKSYEAGTTEYFVAVGRELYSNGFHKEAAEAMNSGVLKETGDHTRTMSNLELMSKINDEVGETAIAALQLDKKQQAEALKKTAAHMKDTFNIDILKILPADADVTTKWNMLKTQSDKGRKDNLDFTSMILEKTKNQIANTKAVAQALRDKKDEEGAKVYDQIAAVLQSNEMAATAKFVADTAVQRGIATKEEMDAITKALQFKNWVTVNGRSKLESEELPGAVHTVHQIVQTAGFTPGEAIDYAEKNLIKETGYIFKTKELQSFTGLPALSKDGQVVTLDKALIDKAIKKRNPDVTDETLYTVSKEQRKAAVNSLANWIKENNKADIDKLLLGKK